MLKRILSLSVAVMALAVVAPAIAPQVGGGVAQAQTPPDAPDTPDVPDTPDTPDTPDVPDTPDAPDAPEAPAPPAAPESPAPPAAPAPPAQPDDSGDGPCADDSRAGAHASGEDDCTPAPLQAPVDQGPVSAPENGQNSGDTESGNSKSTPSPVLETVANVSAGNDTGTSPQGGIQAGGGGTANGGAVSALLLGSGALALVLTAGGVVLRRRSLES
jgi:hypothetical protein